MENTPNSAAGACPVAHGNSTDLGGGPVSSRAEAFDPFLAAYLEDPAEYSRWARDDEPVFYSPKLGYWVLTRYQSVKDVFRDPVTFSPSIALDRLSPTSDEALAVLKRYGYAMGRTMVTEDEPAHMARRRVLMDPFTPASLEATEPMIRRLVRQAVDGFVDDGRADLINQLVWDVPFTVALHFLGIDEEDRQTMRQYSVAHTVNSFGRPSADEQLSIAKTVGEFWQFSGQILEKMRRTPDGPGWMRYSIRKQMEFPDIVTDSYLHSMMMAVIVAAHETTAFASANAIKLLLEHPSAWQDICQDPALISPAIEECLRHSGSVVAWRRITTRDVVVEGVTLPTGSKLLMLMASANRDRRHFADPDFFDIRRENSAEHLAFGFGPHQCLGKNLARMEMQIMLEELSKRLPHMQLCDKPLDYVPNVAFRGPHQLEVEWEPEQNPERSDPERLRNAHPVRIGAPRVSDMVRNLRVESATPAGEHLVRLRLVSPDGAPLPLWTPGAHIDVECGGPDISRQYSLCGDVNDAHAWEITVLRDPNSRGGSAWIHSNVRRDAVLRVRGPRNHFRMDENARATGLLFIAGGIGVTPIKAMAQRAKDIGLPYEIHYSGRSRASMAFLPELERHHGDRLQIYTSDEGRRNDLPVLLRNTDPGMHIYACGPARMLEAIEERCQSWPAEALHVEHFSSVGTTLDPEHERAFEVELRSTGLVLHVPRDRTLLEILRASNVDVQSDCEEGLCGSCEATVLAGEVDHRDVVLTSAERKQNSRMMVCCSRSHSNRLVVDL